jgi:hypothetical protein
VLSHNNRGQLLRLTKALTKLYENPPIVCHHNFTMCPLDQNEFPAGCHRERQGELVSADFDVLLDTRLVEYDYSAVEGPDDKGQFTFSRPYWRSLSYQVSYLSLTRGFTRCKRWLRIQARCKRSLGGWVLGAGGLC